MGIEKVLTSFRDLEVMLALLPRSSTGERMNPYTSLWTGVTTGDGPREFHLVLLDNGRTQALADAVGRQALALHPMQRLPERLPGVLAHGRPRLRVGLSRARSAPSSPRRLVGVENASSLPYASSLCGACYEVCPVKIDIPSMLVDLRRQVVDEQRSRPGVRAKVDPERRGDGGLGARVLHRRGYETPAAGGAAGPVAAGARPDRIGSAPRPAVRAGPRRGTCRACPTRPSASGGVLVRRRVVSASPRGDARTSAAGDRRRAATAGRPPRAAPTARPGTGTARRCSTSSPSAWRSTGRRSRASTAGPVWPTRSPRRAGTWRRAVGRTRGLPDDMATLAAWSSWRTTGWRQRTLDEMDGAITGAPWPSPRRARSCSTGAGAPDAERSPWCATCTSAWSRPSRVVGLLPEAVGAWPGRCPKGGPLTFVSGPSATSDIELQPRRGRARAAQAARDPGWVSSPGAHGLPRHHGLRRHRAEAARGFRSPPGAGGHAS